MDTVWEKIKATVEEPHPVHLTALAFRNNKDLSKGDYIWAWLMVKATPELRQLQWRVVSLLKGLECKPLTNAETYEPHLTLARLPKMKKIIPAIWPQKWLAKPYPMHLALGTCDDMGQYKETLFKFGAKK
jgi:2'-5' RNA ligase